MTLVLESLKQELETTTAAGWRVSQKRHRSIALGPHKEEEEEEKEEEEARQWKIVSELGTGASGAVYRGLWRGQDVAIKRVMFQVRSLETMLSAI